jgi:hypothetical protein
VIAGSAQPVNELKDFGEDASGIASRWITEIQLFERETKTFTERGKKIVRRYRNQKENDYVEETSDSARRFSLLYANVQTLSPVVYGRVPKSNVQRRFKDDDPVGRMASEVAERSLDYFLDCDGKFDDMMKEVVQDYLLPGRGVARLMYIPHFHTVTPQIPVVPQMMADPITGQPIPTNGFIRGDNQQPVDPSTIQQAENGMAFVAGEPYEAIEYEEVVPDYVFWEDFGFTAGARTWAEVKAVWFRVYMTRAELHERFDATIGAEKVDEIPLKHEPKGLDKSDKSFQVMLKAVVYEIWDASERKTTWLCKDFAETPLDVRDDPLQLRNYFPCPKPVTAGQTNDRMNPVADYIQYQDQAEEIDDLTQRIGVLEKALKVRGLYPADSEGIKRLLQEADNTELIPVENWAMYADKGGIKNMIAWFPVQEVAEVLGKCVELRATIKQDVYEITGLSDILRGATDPNETAAAQSIKAQWGSTRVKERQGDVAKFVRDLLRIAFEIIFNKFSDETIAKMVNVESMPDAQLFPQAMQLLRDKGLRHFRVDIETDSTVQPDENADKQRRIEFATAISTMMGQAAEILPAAPMLAPMIGEIIMFVTRGFKGAESLEGIIEKTMDQVAKMGQQAPPPDPAAQAKAQSEQIKAQSEAQRNQVDMAATAVDAKLGEQDNALRAVELGLRAKELNQPVAP